MPSEVYPHPPVRFVAFAASFPLQPRLQREDTKEAVYERLADTFPLLEIINATRVRHRSSAARASSPASRRYRRNCA